MEDDGARSPPVPSSVSATLCRRIDGHVCICPACEATRLRMVHRTRSASSSSSSLKRERDDLETVSSSTSSSGEPRALKRAAESSTTATISKADRLQTLSSACRTILESIGEDPNREGLLKTPERWAKSLLFMCQGYDQTPESVTNGAIFSENHDEMVVVRNIDIHSLCEHHMLPFTGRVSIGYIPNGKILGLSKLARIAELYARRLQVQERLTRQIADAIVETIDPLGVAVVVECTHFCMVVRGVQKTGAITTTSSVRGCFESNPKTRAEFFSIIQGNGIKMC